ncbi:MAG: flagellar filament capping protein FliD [Selenomonadaceae bacterium]|nr:flagellar filament capping protein FliD [Selenomonadaceae bacterium]
MGVNGIYGLSGSGMDIESMVKVGMMSKQNEYDKMAQKYTKNEWMKADYLELSSKITTFNASTLSQYKMSNTMNAKSAESTSSAVSVMANSNAPLMAHKVEVEKLSSNAYLLSTGKLTRYDGNGNVASDSTSIELKNILFKSLSISEDGNTATYNILNKPDGTGSIGVRSTPLNSSNERKAKAMSFTISDGATLEKDAAGNDIAGKLKEVEISFTYKEINDGATLNDLVSKINAAGLNIRAAYDSVNDSFSLYNTKGGAGNEISIKVGGDAYPAEQGDTTDVSYLGTATARFLNSLQLYQSRDGELYDPLTLLDNDDSSLTAVADETKNNGGKALNFVAGATNPARAVGSYGVMKIDGVEYSDITDNKKTVNGVTYTALNTTAATGAATVSVAQDTDSIIDKVKSFITDYNKLLADLYAKYDEKPNSDYKPLTQSQKDQMKEEQITKWEEKAKAGMLYHDQTLGKVIQTMRDAVSETVSGINSKYNSIYSLGISTTGIKGQLVLDEDKLKKALAEDPDSVYNVFAKLESTETSTGSAVYKTVTNANGSVTVTSESNGNGIAQRLGDIFVSANKLIKDRAGSSADITEDSDLNNLLRNLQTKMSNFKKLMNSFEDALYKKYDAMESTLAKLGMQLNYVMGGQQ